MAVRLRLRRTGSKNKPCYRIVAADSRSPRDGRFIEILGYYDPRHEDEKINLGRVEYWISNGAQPSKTVAALIKRVKDSPAELKESVPDPVESDGITEATPSQENSFPDIITAETKAAAVAESKLESTSDTLQSEATGDLEVNPGSESSAASDQEPKSQADFQAAEIREKDHSGKSSGDTSESSVAVNEIAEESYSDKNPDMTSESQTIATEVKEKETRAPTSEDENATPTEDESPSKES